MEVIVTPTDVTNVAPEFASVESATIEMFIDMARGLICASKFGSKAKQAIIFLTAHLMKEIGYGDGGSTSSSASGPVTSEKVGDLQRSYGQVSLSNGSVTDSLFATTKYGRLYVILRKQLVITPMVT